MNQLLQQLKAQAEFVGDRYALHDEFAEKFAELIVRECIDYCGENLSNTVGGALKIHFGVDSKPE
jgi:hypothetical protein